MSSGGDLFRQSQLGPAKLSDGLNVPDSFLERQLSLQDDHVLCPADGHGVRHYLRGILIDAVKIPHPAQVPGRKTGAAGIGAMQIFGSSHSRALLPPAVDQTANLTIQFHLGQFCRHQLIQRGVQGAVIGGFSDIHGLLLSSAVRLSLWGFNLIGVLRHSMVYCPRHQTRRWQPCAQRKRQAPTKRGSWPENRFILFL